MTQQAEDLTREAAADRAQEDVVLELRGYTLWQLVGQDEADGLRWQPLVQDLRALLALVQQQEQELEKVRAGESEWHRQWVLKKAEWKAAAAALSAATGATP